MTQYLGWSEQPKPWWGKTQAERLIYVTAIVRLVGAILGDATAWMPEHTALADSCC